MYDPKIGNRSAPIESWLTLPKDCYWLDEFDNSPAPVQIQYSMTGSLVLQQLFPKRDGKNMTLKLDWCDLPTLKALEALKDSGLIGLGIRLYDGRIFDGIFRNWEDKPVEASPLIERPDYEINPSVFLVTLKLMVV